MQNQQQITPRRVTSLSLNSSNSSKKSYKQTNKENTNSSGKTKFLDPKKFFKVTIIKICKNPEWVTIQHPSGFKNQINKNCLRVQGNDYYTTGKDLNEARIKALSWWKNKKLEGQKCKNS